MTGVGFTVLKAFLKKYPEFGIKFFAVGSVILGFYIAEALHQRDIETEFVILSALIVSLCFYILYIITAGFKLLKKYEKNLNSGFNLSVVLTFLITLISFYLESEGRWTFCIGLCNTSDFSFIHLFYLQPFFAPVSLILYNLILGGDGPKKRFLFGVILSIPFCILAFICSGSAMSLLLHVYNL